MGTMIARGRFVPALAAILILAFTTAAGAQQGARGKNTYLRGHITAFENGMLTVKTVGGETLTVSVPKKARISSLTRVDFSTIRKGDFIASAGMRQKDGTLRALEVRVFPAGGFHPREVHRKFRLGPDSTMTNATVEAFIGDVSGRTFKVKYKGGEQTITVPEGVYVMRQTRGKADLLKPGAGVSVLASKGKDGKLRVVRMNVGLNGLMPPT